MLKEPEDERGWWKTRNGAYATIVGMNERGLGVWTGMVYDEDGKEFCIMKWDRKLNSLISKDYDLMRRYSNREQKGWPTWLHNAASAKMEPLVSRSTELN